ncbi:MAG: hypothetical protein ACRCUS_10665, partial [Anaerovoracaceae bacterium]
GVKNSNAVDYALQVQIPLLTNRYRPKKVGEKDLQEYATIIAEYFNQILSFTDKILNTEIYPCEYVQYAAVKFTFEDKSEKIDKTNQCKIKNISLFKQFEFAEYNDFFYKKRDYLYFSENDFFIFKRNDFKNWHKAVAELDLEEIREAIMTSGVGR